MIYIRKLVHPCRLPVDNLCMSIVGIVPCVVFTHTSHILDLYSLPLINKPALFTSRSNIKKNYIDPFPRLLLFMKLIYPAIEVEESPAHNVN